MVSEIYECTSKFSAPDPTMTGAPGIAPPFQLWTVAFYFMSDWSWRGQDKPGTCHLFWLDMAAHQIFGGRLCEHEMQPLGSGWYFQTMCIQPCWPIVLVEMPAHWHARLLWTWVEGWLELARFLRVKSTLWLGPQRVLVEPPPAVSPEKGRQVLTHLLNHALAQNMSKQNT